MRHLTESPSVAVERALTILEMVAHHPNGMSNAEISRQLEIPKSSASYILRTLEHRSYLRRDGESGRYRLGLQVLSLSRGALTGLDVREVGLPFMRTLVEKTGLTCHLAILDSLEAVYIEKVEAPGFIKMDTWIGRRMDVHTTAVGKALVAYIPQEELDRIIAARGLSKHTGRTVTNAAKFYKDLEQVRELGYSMDDEENNLGVRCIGAPIFNESGHAEASIGLSGPLHRVNSETLPRLIEQVKETARRISGQLGYPGAGGRRSSVARIAL